MEKRVLLAITLSFLVLAGYQYFFVKPLPRPVRPAPSATAPPPGDTADRPPSATTAPRPGGEAPAVSAAPQESAQPAASLVGEAEARDIVVENDDIRAVFTNRGARLKSWELKRYLDERGRPVDLVPGGLSDEEPRPFSVLVDDAAVTQRLNGALFRASAGSMRAEAGATLTFDYEGADGLRAVKQFTFSPENKPYVVHLTAQVARGGEPLPFAVSSGPGLGDPDRAAGGGSFLSPSYYQKPQAIFQMGSDVTRLPSEKLAGSPTHQGQFRYVGTEDHYFLFALLPGDRQARVDYRTVGVAAAEGPRTLVAYSMRLDQPWQDVAFYLGPKHFDQLATVDRELVRTINFGIFDWLVVPLLRALNWINGYVGNYGWSIILLTILINLITWPLRHRSMVSMRKMQALQPQVKAIQDRYANLKMTDPAKQKMNTELMNLYREKGVNPAGGCVPMLLTFPVLFAFYSMLSQAIELRGAPFVGWIHDLSTRDPLFITPILMGVTMVWQQRMSPSTADPVQQKVFMFMPVMFTVMFLWAPSGLVLYWFVSNLLAIAQQYFTNRMIGAPPAPAKPAAARV